MIACTSSDCAGVKPAFVTVWSTSDLSSPVDPLVGVAAPLIVAVRAPTERVWSSDLIPFA